MLKIKTEPNGAKEYVDQVQDTGNTDYIQGGVVYKNAPTKSVMVSSQSDLATLSGYAPGTIAYTAGFKALWQLDATGQWVSL